jgi:hypothetical protein
LAPDYFGAAHRFRNLSAFLRVADRHVAALRPLVGCPFHFEDLFHDAIRQVRPCQGDVGSRDDGVGRANHLPPQDGSEEPVEHLLDLILVVYRGEVAEDQRGAPAQEGVVVFEQAHERTHQG